MAPSLSCVGPEITATCAPTADPVAVLPTMRTPTATADPAPDPVPCFALVANATATADEEPDPVAVICHIGAPK